MRLSSQTSSNLFRKINEKLSAKPALSWLPKLWGYDTISYWHDRVDQMGAKSVYNKGHDDAELSSVDEMQREKIMPHFQQQLRGDETRILDFGCGPGRFSGLLADLSGAEVVGADPMQKLLDAAPPHPKVSYRAIPETGELPLADASVDVIWSCLVLGCIVDDRGIAKTHREFQRILKPGGLLFIVENTAPLKSLHYFKFREIDTYLAMFDFTPLDHLCDYYDKEERISIMCGRKV